MATLESKTERQRLGLALLAASGKLVAAQAARQQIEDREIYFELVRTGEPMELIGSQYRTARGYVLQPDDKVIRRLRHPEREAELRQEVLALDALIKEQTELRFWILKELENTEVAAWATNYQSRR
jgi:hypothetical protein